MSRLWIASEDEKNTEDGVYYIPQSICQTFATPKRVHWILVADRSGSMKNLCFGSQNQSYWNTAVMLMEEIVKLLKSYKRDDILTLICFNDKHTIPIHQKKIESIDSITQILSDRKIEPEGLTDISNANTAAFIASMETDNKEFDVAELFFTDGEPTKGIMEDVNLASQKESLCREVKKKLGHDPFLWCCGIGELTSLVRALGDASKKRSLWSCVDIKNMESFATDIGTAVSLMLHSFYLEFLDAWAPNDISFFRYLPQKPMEQLDTHVFPQLVHICRIQKKLMDGKYRQSDLAEYTNQLKNLPEVKEKNVDLLLFYGKTLSSVTVLLEDLKTCNLPSQLTRQVSLFREASEASPGVRHAQRDFSQAYTTYTRSGDHGADNTRSGYPGADDTARGGAVSPLMEQVD